MLENATTTTMMRTGRPATDDDTSWQAVIERDASYDGQFVLAVQTTGIYCRPTCPAKRPLRQNVLFFEQPDDARQAGFRACLRCKPDDATAPAAQIAERAREYLDANLDRTVTLAELGDAIGVSPHHLQRTFKRVLGISPRAYVDARRLGEVKSGLKDAKDMTVTDALYDAGYGSSSRLYERAGAQLGMTPGAYKRGGRGMSITYAIADSPLGQLLVAATERGVSAVYLGENVEELAATLRAEYPAAEIAPDASGHLDEWVTTILRHLRGERPSTDLPLDVQATAFQWRVWQELRRIPSGETRTYGQVAAALGQPTAVRAVARACATNPVAITVPCHRVVHSSGSTREGYRWGVERKRALLAREQEPA
jgi:AraC family transcriptional regulator, regulatory protein of adaptative response / methylated-DNA-[protein]-cysteine methyltransferase